VNKAAFYYSQREASNPMKVRATILAVLVMLLCSSASRAQGPVRSPAELGPSVQGSNQFAVELYAHLRSARGNLFFSPWSLSTALALAQAGARGGTAEQMAQTLHLAPDTKDRQRRFTAGHQGSTRDGAARGLRLLLVNTLWGQTHYGFQPAYLKTAKDSFGAELVEVDFGYAPGAARKTINDHIARQTEGKIQDLIPDRLLDATTRLVLTNAVYFEANWATPFPKAHTKEGLFHSGKDQTAKVQFMNLTARLPYFEDNKLQALELPYAGGELALDVILPRALDGLGLLEKDLTSATLAEWVRRLRSRSVAVALPRFRTSAQFELREVLSQMGMPVAFSETDADFSGMTENEAPLYLAAVVHKAFVEVSEEGTEAAAASAVAAKVRSIDVSPSSVFRADHPFLFLIRDKRSGKILFLGRLCEPR
jgi:serpin B